MEGLGGVVFLLVMGVAWIIGQVFEHLRVRRAAAPTPEEEPIEAESVESARESVPTPRADRRPASAWRAERVLDARKVEPASGMRNAARRLVTGRDNLRRAVIMTTVLGPPVSQQSSNAPFDRGV